MIIGGVDRAWTQTLRGLIGQYGEFQVAPPGTTRRRGQMFNAFIAGVHQHWGVDAEADLRGVDGRDEIDVAFTLNDVYYVLEAKWHARA